MFIRKTILVCYILHYKVNAPSRIIRHTNFQNCHNEVLISGHNVSFYETNICTITVQF